jgi:hypothetical protein
VTLRLLLGQRQGPLRFLVQGVLDWFGLTSLFLSSALLGLMGHCHRNVRIRNSVSIQICSSLHSNYARARIWFLCLGWGLHFRSEEI